MRLKTLIYTVCAAALAPIFAQGTAQAQSAVQAAADDEIIVTARKHGDEHVQDVPLAVTAFGAAQLDALNFQDLQSLSYTMPNVQLEDVGTLPGYANFSIRGLGINSSIPSIDPAVGVFVDGVYMGIPAGVVSDNFDLEGVEVLRGPQGVLFGRNVTGGAVLLRTSEPSDTFAFSGRVGVESGLRYYGDAVVTGPLVEGLAGKLAVYHSDDEGYFENFDGNHVGASRQTIIRPALRFSPNDDLDITLRLEHGEVNGDGTVSQNHALHPRSSDSFAINERGFQDDSWDQAILQSDWDISFGNGTITNIVGWRQYESDSLADVDGNTTLAVGFNGSAYFTQDQISEELRYAGTFGDWDVTAGLYYFQQNLFYIEHRNIGNGAVRGTGGGDGDFSTYGAFVSTDWHINPEFALNLGLRYTHEEKEAAVRTMTFDPLAANYNARILNPNFFSEDSWNDISPRIGFQWTPNEDTQLYGFWSKGFRSGGYNFRQTVAISPGVTPGPFDSEEQSSFELGLKQDFADRRGRVNIAIFHNQIDGMQREINSATSPFFGVNQQIVNAGDATIQGAEIEARWRFTDNLLVSLQVGYTDGQYDTVVFDLNGDSVINSADEALEIPRLSPWTYGVSVMHDLNFGDVGVLASRLSFSHRDKNFYTDNNVGFFDAVDLFDANFTFTPSSGPWTLSLYGQNLTDENTYGGDTILPDSAPFGGDGVSTNQPPTFSPLNRGRVIGAEMRVRF